MPLRLDVQFARSVHHGTHRLHTVAHEIQQDLLYLDPITQHVWDIVAEDGAQGDMLPACLRPHEHDDFLDRLLHVQWGEHGRGARWTRPRIRVRTSLARRTSRTTRCT